MLRLLSILHFLLRIIGLVIQTDFALIPIFAQNDKIVHSFCEFFSIPTEKSIPPPPHFNITRIHNLTTKHQKAMHYAQPGLFFSFHSLICFFLLLILCLIVFLFPLLSLLHLLFSFLFRNKSIVPQIFRFSENPDRQPVFLTNDQFLSFFAHFAYIFLQNYLFLSNFHPLLFLLVSLPLYCYN